MAGETLTVTIEKLVQGGRGLARLDGKVLLVRGAIPAETVAVTGGTAHKQYQEATVSKVLVPSPDRVVPPCPVYEACGGCQLQHLRYEAQLAHKAAILKETLARVGKLTVEDVAQVVPSPTPYGYRSAVRFVVFREGRGFALGFHEEGSHRPVAASCCLLVPDAMRDVIGTVNGRLAAQTKLPARLESIEVRWSISSEEVLFGWRTGPASRSSAERLFDLFQDVPGVIGQVVTAQGSGRWIRGQPWITERLADLSFRISDRSFMQANWVLNDTLSRTVGDWALSESSEGGEPRRRVLELHAGIGTLGLPLARRGALVTLVEGNAHAVADARHAAKINHVGRTRFRHARAEELLAAVHPGDYDLIIVDPPRTGLSRECVREVLRLEIPRVLYISCDPATLARDLGLLAGSYRITRLQPFDMFPQTAHLETLVELAR
jgi:23S rRNA (uracil1939-C5)-methyltransferase